MLPRTASSCERPGTRQSSGSQPGLAALQHGAIWVGVPDTPSGFACNHAQGGDTRGKPSHLLGPGTADKQPWRTLTLGFQSPSHVPGWFETSERASFLPLGETVPGSPLCSLSAQCCRDTCCLHPHRSRSPTPALPSTGRDIPRTGRVTWHREYKPPDQAGRCQWEVRTALSLRTRRCKASRMGCRQPR